jgi:hypothetical protein
MFIKFRQVEGIYSLTKWKQFFLCDIKDTTGRMQLCKMDKDFVALVCSREKTIIGYHIHNDDLVYVSKDSRKTTCVNLSDFNMKYEHMDILINLTPDISNVINDRYYGYSKSGGFVIFDLRLGHVLTSLNARNLFSAYFFSNKRGVTYDRKKVRVVDLSLEIVWEYAIDETVETPTEIDRVQCFEEKLFVLGENVIVAFNMFDGRRLWVREMPYRPIALSLHNSFGYIVTGHHYAVIDLHSGNLLIDKKLEDFAFRGQTLQFDGYGRVYHEGLVWCCLQTNGYYFVAAIYPEDGRVVWREHVNTPHSVHAPRFHEDKMYVLDTGGNLHIYQKSVT